MTQLNHSEPRAASRQLICRLVRHHGDRMQPNFKRREKKRVSAGKSQRVRIESFRDAAITESRRENGLQIEQFRTNVHICGIRTGSHLL